MSDAGVAVVELAGGGEVLMRVEAETIGGEETGM